MNTQRFIEGTDIPRVAVDPVSLQVLGGAFKTVAQEMGMVLYRMSYSSIIRESEDLGAGIVDTIGRQLCESESTPMHVGSIGGYVKGFLTRLQGNIDDGDVIVHNHPFYGASHSPDMHIAIPIFYQGKLISYSCVQAHLLDNGSHTSGLDVDARDIYAETRILYGLKLFEKGKRNDQLWQMILDNVRTPTMNENDMQAMIAACQHGSKRFIELIEKYGLETVMSATEEWMDYSERMLRQEIAKIPDGTYYADAWLDHDGKNLAKMLKVCATTTVSGDSLIIDLTGSADEVMTAFNVSFEGSTKTAINYIIHTVFLDEVLRNEYIPQNDGMTRPLTIIAPKGCIFNPNFPRATFSRFNQANLLADCVMRSLAPFLPERVSAGTSAHIHFISYSGFIEQKGEYWVYLEVNEGSYGGRYGKDAMDAVDALVANTRNVPIEEIEWHHPLRVERYELADAKVAPGKWRGGLGIVRETRFLCDGTLTCEGDRHKEAPKGIFGGQDGTAASLTKNPHGDHPISLPSKLAEVEMAEGDVLQVSTPCGGGYGQPFERDPQQVLADVLDDFTTIEDAKSSYGVMIDPWTMTVDKTATEELRSAKE
jgi:N-methylhydantoinase B/oxoprolinase/acetone carboxylase alpha subunit